MVKIETIRSKNDLLDRYFPEAWKSPPGKYVDHRRLFYPDCYLAANKTRRALKRQGFKLDEAGVHVAVEPYDVAVKIASLSGILKADMRTQIPSYFMSLTSLKRKQPPSYITRTITSTINEPNKNQESIVREWGTKRTITFESQPPYREYENVHDTDEVEQLFMEELGRRLGKLGIDNPLNRQNIVILAGIGKNSRTVAESITGNANLQVEDVKYGSRVMILAMLSMALLDWGMKKPNKSLFFVTTARLTNDQDSPPSSYILNKIFVDLGWDPVWLGLCCARGGAIREHPTGAVLVEIKPEQYQVALDKARTQFNQAVEKMITAKENAGLF